MFEVKIHDISAAKESEWSRVVCVSRFNGKWVLCKHKQRDTWELPGGHIEKGEDWLSAAKREMMEETGAVKMKVMPLCLYSVSKYGLLCFVEIEELGKIPEGFEIEKIGFFDTLPDELTYPETHRLLFETALEKYKNL